jgi:hypothetical protein
LPLSSTLLCDLFIRCCRPAAFAPENWEYQ